MTYQVVLQRHAKQDLQEAYDSAAQQAPLPAARWLSRFEAALNSLQRNPTRCPLAREDQRLDVELRELHFGRRPFVYRVIFTVDGEFVRILRIRRAQRRFLTRQQIEDALGREDDHGP